VTGPVREESEEACCLPELLRDPLDERAANQLAEVFKALADPARLRLVSLVATTPGGEVCACDLPAFLGRSQPTVSHHLSLLVRAGVFEREQRGKWAWFRLRPGALASIAGQLIPGATTGRTMDGSGQQG
jgi:ArsR family transcriptional regulator